MTDYFDKRPHLQARGFLYKKAVTAVVVAVDQARALQEVYRVRAHIGRRRFRESGFVDDYLRSKEGRAVLQETVDQGLRRKRRNMWF